MLSMQDNETLTRVGPGTPMGEFMRKFWIPACRSDELSADADPLRIMLLGEKLLGFRDTSGRAGIMDHRCPHRGASLFYGRNEDGGIRCVYHGWKYGVDGTCLDMPNLPEDKQFRSKVRAKAYPVQERNGVVWVYMGAEAQKLPPLPEIEVLMLPADQVTIRCVQRQCNWLQSLEGEIDSSHFSFLHLGKVGEGDVDAATMHRFAVSNRAPDYRVKETDWGTMYCTYRSGDPGTMYYRVAHYVYPFFTLYPDGTFEDHIVAQAWVPMDDTHTMVFNFQYKGRTEALRTDKRGDYLPGFEGVPALLPNTTDWYGRWRLEANASNDFMIDRDAQRNRSFTGILGVHVQDQAIIESMGEIVDRSFEHLAYSDRMVMATRRTLLNAVRALKEREEVPRVRDEPGLCRQLRSGAFIADETLDWLDAYVQQCGRVADPAGIFRVPASPASGG